MGLILCPECGTKISDKALVCSYCGFYSADKSRPISEQDKYQVVPFFDYDIEEWNPNRGDLSLISYEDNRVLNSFFGKLDNIKNYMPGIAKVIENWIKKDHILAADIDDYIKDLIDKGIYRFSIDKQGNILPTIRDCKGIVKQVRLKEITFSPRIIDSLNNLSVHAAMAQIIDKIECLGDSIAEVHEEIKDSHIAMAESARDKLRNACKIMDSRLRENQLLNVVNSATDSKRQLMRRFLRCLEELKIEYNKSKVEKVFKNKKNTPRLSEEAFQTLVYLTNSIQTECEGFAILGEYEACRNCLEEFKSFIEINSLNDRDTLLLINECASEKRIDIVDDFSYIADKIVNFELSFEKLTYQNIGKLTSV